jgi:spermidine synthase
VTPGPEPRAAFWFTDVTTPGEGFRYAVTRVLVSRHTRFQDLAIIDTAAYGKALVLDDNWQSCVADEFLYHEPLVHPAMLAHGAPRQVVVFGGGEGATVREVLRWRSIERVVMVDLDGEVVDACREHLPEMHQGAFDDHRVELVIGNALDWLDSDTDAYDVVISDLSEPLEHGPAFKLFTKEYFERIRPRLTEHGVFAIQAGSVAANDLRLFARVTATVAAAFGHVRPYASTIPSFAAPWGFVVASTGRLAELPQPDQIDRVLAEHTTGGLRMMDGIALHGLFMLPAHVRRAVQEETEIYTLADPPRR